MFESACVVGAGRVGKAMAARLRKGPETRVAGRELDCGDADLVLLCVPDRAIGEVAAAIPPGPWVAHTSGACRLDVLAPHERRFSLHPLQTFTLDRGPEQLDGAWAAVSAETDEALAAANALAALLGVKAFELDDEARPLYHAAASFASAFLVTLHDVASELMEAAGAPPAALEPLMLRTIENGFNHTGPLVRGDVEVVERHAEAIALRRPQLLPLYRALAKTEATLLGARR
ncbi:MAG TPA: DUF2520 domain-containing protein [Gaiellaceae bacterium]|nr:DUF2520 domain-containing protein [Gaiellaceae bacterium]